MPLEFDHHRLADRKGGPAWVRSCCFLLAACLLGYAIHLGDGTFSLSAVRLLAGALLLSMAGVWVVRIRGGTLLGIRAEELLCAAIVAFSVYQFSTRPLTTGIPTPPPDGVERGFFAALAVASMAAGLALANHRWGRGLAVAALLAGYLWMGSDLIRAAPSPPIDVFVFHQDGLAALFEGRNPYTITIENLYGEGSRNVYPPGVIKNGRVDFGYPYPPASLLAALPGYALSSPHDFRWSFLAINALSALLIYLARPSALAAGAAAVFLLTPRGMYVIQQGWTEPVVVLGLAATIFCSIRLPRLMWFAFGAWLATKHYVFFITPLLFLLLPRPLTWRAVLIGAAQALLTACVITLPLALWDWGAFSHSVLSPDRGTMFRRDALTFLTYAYFYFDVRHPPSWVTFFAGLVAMSLYLWRGARNVAGFAAGCAATFAAIFAFGFQGFANHHFLVIASLCFAAVLCAPLDSEPPKTAENRA